MQSSTDAEDYRTVTFFLLFLEDDECACIISSVRSASPVAREVVR